jgi:hypothetical protein
MNAHRCLPTIIDGAYRPKCRTCHRIIVNTSTIRVAVHTFGRVRELTHIRVAQWEPTP